MQFAFDHKCRKRQQKESERWKSYCEQIEMKMDFLDLSHSFASFDEFSFIFNEKFNMSMIKFDFDSTASRLIMLLRSPIRCFMQFTWSATQNRKKRSQKSFYSWIAGVIGNLSNVSYVFSLKVLFEAIALYPPYRKWALNRYFFPSQPFVCVCVCVRFLLALWVFALTVVRFTLWKPKSPDDAKPQVHAKQDRIRDFSI